VWGATVPKSMPKAQEVSEALSGEAQGAMWGSNVHSCHCGFL
jgi:hypothetical protein